MDCCYCERPGARALAAEVEILDPDSGQPLRLRPVMCPTCELLVFPEVAAVADDTTDLDDDVRRLRGLAQFWIESELARIFKQGSPPEGCWWCHAPGRELPIEQRSAVEVEFEFARPTLCFACQGLLYLVGGGFSLQDAAEAEAQKEAYERVLRAAH
jgi:hypothetical protein